jgi:hypothetical protein
MGSWRSRQVGGMYLPEPYVPADAPRARRSRASVFDELLEARRIPQLSRARATSDQRCAKPSVRSDARMTWPTS